MEGHVRLIESAGETDPEFRIPEPGSETPAGEEWVDPVDGDAYPSDYPYMPLIGVFADPESLRANIINEATEAAENGLLLIKRALKLLAVVDAPASQAKEKTVMKEVNGLFNYLEEKT